MPKKRKQRQSSKSVRKLLRKRNVIVAWLNEQGFDVNETTGERDLLDAAYIVLGRDEKVKHVTLAGAHRRYSEVISEAGLQDKLAAAHSVTNRDIKSDVHYWDTKKFYESFEWRKLRYQIIKRDGGRCQACGATPETGAVLNVDHIKPLKHYWSLRLDPDNLQTLCHECNHGKGNWDETDWRSEDTP